MDTRSSPGPGLHFWSLALVLGLLTLSLIIAGWSTWSVLHPAKRHDLAHESGQELIGEMDELDESRLPTMADMATDLWMPQQSTVVGALESDDYRLTDDDYVPKAMGRGYLILPARGPRKP